uniref:GH18 domain-containing protein n=1 Tax=Anopheles minimus TaxID=112268 RepID=A0A182WJT7_9DIPT
MIAPWRTVFYAASCLVTVLVVCGVVQVHSVPCGTQGSAHLAKIVCFITASNEHYDYDSLRTGLCSHIMLIDLIGVGKDGSLELLQTSSRSLNRFCKMKQRFYDVGDEAKFVISIGGVAQKSSHFSKALKTAESRLALSDELISFTNKHKLGGIDIAWFYPAQFGGAESDRTNLVVFLRELYLRTKACAITLSLTVGVDPKDIELSYDVPCINNHVDFVNLLTGDYHSPTSATHISPLYGQGPRDRLNINHSVMSYIEAGLNPQKIIIMGSCYAYLYVSKIYKEGTTCSTKLRTVMRLSYLSGKELITRESFHTSWDDMRHVPYGTLTNGITKKWLTYNDVESMKRKADYAQHYQLGGMGLFSVDEDDYGGRAGCGRYPMLRAIVSVLYPELDCTEEEMEDEVETILCPYTGYLTDPTEPECYYMCEQGIGLHECPKKCCPQGETFSTAQNGCYQPVVAPSAPYIADPIYYMTGPSSDVYQPPVQYQQSNMNTGTQLSYDHPTTNTGTQKSTGLVKVAQENIPMIYVGAASSPAPVYQPLPVTASPPKVSSQVAEVVPMAYVASPSTMSPMYASFDEPVIQASNIMPQVVVIPNAAAGHISLGLNANDEVEMLNTPCALKADDPALTTDPPILITPKTTSHRTSKRVEKSRKRKSRSKSHSSKTTSTVNPNDTTHSTSTVSTTVQTTLSTSGENVITTPKSTAKPSRARKTTATTSLAPVTKTSEPSTISSTYSSTSSTTTIATTTTTTAPSTLSTTMSTTLSTTVTPNVTFSDKTSTIDTSLTTTLSSEQVSTTTLSSVPTTLSNTWITTTKGTSRTTTTEHDAPLPLETTIT